MILSNRRYNCCQEISIDIALNGIGLLYNLRYDQCWGRYFEKVTSYILLVTFRKSNSLHITDYFQEKVLVTVTYYSDKK